jgi:hypothetical protein
MLIQVRNMVSGLIEVRRVNQLTAALVGSGLVNESAAQGTLVEEKIDRSRPVSQKRNEEECPAPHNKEEREQRTALLGWAALVVALYLNEDYEVVLKEGTVQDRAPVQKKVSARVRLMRALKKMQAQIKSLSQVGWDTVVNHGVLGMYCRRAIVLSNRLASC